MHAWVIVDFSQAIRARFCFLYFFPPSRSPERSTDHLPGLFFSLARSSRCFNESAPGLGRCFFLNFSFFHPVVKTTEEHFLRSRGADRLASFPTAFILLSPFFIFYPELPLNDYGFAPHSLARVCSRVCRSANAFFLVVAAPAPFPPRTDDGRLAIPRRRSALSKQFPKDVTIAFRCFDYSLFFSLPGPVVRCAYLSPFSGETRQSRYWN